jgi:hypothetical protein
LPAFAPRKRGGHQALPPFLARSLNTEPTAGPEVETFALLDFSAAVFLGFFASRLDLLWLLAMAASSALRSSSVMLARSRREARQLPNRQRRAPEAGGDRADFPNETEHRLDAGVVCATAGETTRAEVADHSPS